MKILLVGKLGSLTHWLEDAAAAFRGEGHAIELGIVRHAAVSLALERWNFGALLHRLERRTRRFRPDLIVCIGGFHVPEAALHVLRSAGGGAPIAGWVGDIFAPGVRPLADLCDLLAYTDSALLARHREMGFAAKALFLPHAVDPRAWPSVDARRRRAGMVFVATPTPERQRIVDELALPISLYGGRWRPAPSIEHDIHPRRLAKSALPRVYGAHLAALNIRNEANVLAGLNQRSFEPALAGAALVADDQADLPLCFEPGREVYVWRDVDELNEIHARILREPGEAAAVGERGRRRVLADHTYANRLESLVAAL